jgi:tRNA (guanine37-N1)-methyltransferase
MNDESPAAPFRIDVFTIFPEIFIGTLNTSILKRAKERSLVQFGVHDIRDWTEDRHRSVDDTPYGGGAGMVLSAPPIVHAVESVLGPGLSQTKIVLMSAAGRRLDQSIVQDLAASKRLALICGRYEGIDERVAEILHADQISVGDYVLTGGEIAALVVMDAVTRLRPGVIDAESVAEESHSTALVEYPHYTRPPSFRGHEVPKVLLGGDHAKIRRWRAQQSLAKTARFRHDRLSVKGNEFSRDDE